jgi:hypothetical protein
MTNDFSSSPLNVLESRFSTIHDLTGIVPGLTELDQDVVYRLQIEGQLLCATLSLRTAGHS